MWFSISGRFSVQIQFAKLSDSIENLQVFLLLNILEINFLGAFISMVPLSVLNPSGISLSKPLMTQLVLCLAHSHSLLRMRKYAGNRAERRSLSDLRAVMARHFLRLFILPTVAPNLNCVVFAAVADYSSSHKHLSEHIEFSNLSASSFGGSFIAMIHI